MAGFHVTRGPGTDGWVILTRGRNKHTRGGETYQTGGCLDINIIIDVGYSDGYLKVYPANTQALVFNHSNR